MTGTLLSKSREDASARRLVLPTGLNVHVVPLSEPPRAAAVLVDGLDRVFGRENCEISAALPDRFCWFTVDQPGHRLTSELGSGVIAEVSRQIGAKIGVVV